MKIVIEREGLVRALDAVVGVADGKMLSSVSSVLIEAADGTLTLTTTDGELSARVVETVDIGQFGRALLPAKKLYDIAKSLPDGPVELMMEKIKGTVKAGATTFQLLGLDPSQFGDVPEPDMSHDVEIDADLLRGVLRRTLYAIGANDTRYVLHGLYVEVKGGQLTAVATDGHRLAVEEWPGVVREDAEWSGIIPRKAVQQLAKRLDGVEMISLGMTYGRLFHAWVSGYRLTSRLIEGTYPAWKRLVPRTPPANALTVAREELMAALKRVQLVYGLIRAEYGEAGLVLSCQNVNTGEVIEEVESSYSGEPFRTGFQSYYLLETLHALTGETVVLRQDGATGILRVTDPKLQQSRAFIMPIKS